MKIFLAADHAGFDLKEKIFAYLSRNKYDVEDLGNEQFDPNDDYPQFAYAVATRVLGEDDARGVLICGSGQGICIAANRVHGIRASLCWNEEVARETREDNDSNVLCLPSRLISEEEAMNILQTWLDTPFSGAPRHLRRIKEIEELYG